MDRAKWIEEVRKHIEAVGGTPPESLEGYLEMLEARLLGECRRTSFPEEAYREMAALAAYGSIATAQAGDAGAQTVRAITEGDTRVEYGSDGAGSAIVSPAVQYADAYQRFIWHWRCVPW